MTKKKRNTKSPKKMRGKWKPFLCMALLTVLCASTLSYGTVFAGTADAEESSEVTGINADAEALSEGAEVFTDGENTPPESSSPGNVPSDEAEESVPGEYYEAEDASDADDTAAGTYEDAETGTDAGAEPDADDTEAGTDEKAEAEADEEESDAESAEDEEPAGEGRRVVINQGEGGTLSFINAPENVAGVSSDDDSAYYAIYLPGDTVRLKAVVDTKSPVLNANIYTAGGERIDAQWTGVDEFWFIMPDEDVTISPSYYGITDNFHSFDRSVQALNEQLAFLPRTLSGSDQCYYKNVDYISYAGGGTGYRTADGNVAYCVQPAYDGPDDGWYTKHYDVENYIVVDNKSYGYEYVKSALWVSYGSPGFDPSYWPSVWYDGTAMNSARYYVLAHIVLADIYSANAYAALYGTNEDFRAYAYAYVTGYNADGSESYNFANSTRGKIASALAANGNKSFADDGFTIFIIHNANNYQDIVSFEYIETPDTYLTLQKISSNTGFTGNNDNYSLAGAVYYAYTDEACTELAKDIDGADAKFVTTSSGSSNLILMDEGTYWVKESTASEGYSLDTSVHKVTVTGDNTEDNPAKVTSEEPPKYGYIELTKRSANNGVTDDNGLYSLKGAEFGIYSDETCTELVESLTTNGSGYAMSGSLPLGTYYVKETVRPDGYSIDDGTVYKTVITSDPDAGSTVVAVNGSEGVSDSPLCDTLGIEIVKFDGETGESIPQGDADLSGAEFAVNFYAGDVPESAVSETVPTRSWVIETQKTDGGTYEALLDESHLVSGDALYYDGTGSVVLPLGTYTIKEISAPTGYLVRGTFSDSDGNAVSAGEVYYTQILDDGSASGKAVWLRGDNGYTQTDAVIRGGVKVQKRDLESGRTEAQGAATFEGAVFTIKNESEWPVLVDSILYQPGEDVMTLVTDENGYAETASDALPYGTYRIYETQQPAGNLLGSVVLDAAADQLFEIRTDGGVVDLTGPDDSITDQVKRADFSFEKQDGDNQSTDMGSIKFRITSETTGESHIFWTDMNGQYSSSSDWEPHSQNTNAGETFEDGLWFYGYADWDEAGLDYVDDGVGALPYDTYILEELPCEGNAGYTLITTRFTVYGDNTDLGVRANVHLGTIDNYSYGFVTKASNAENGEKYLEAGETAQITDEITYWGLTRGESYRFVAELYDVTAEDMVRDGDGNALAVETVFTPWLSEGTHAVRISFDAAGLEGHTLVIFEYLYSEDDEIIAAEADAENEDQAIAFKEPEPEEPEELTYPEEPEEPETPETADRPGTTSTPDTPSSSSTTASPAGTGDVGTTLWVIVVAAAASCLILGFATRRRIRRS